MQALELWVAKVVEHRPDVIRIGCFGSYARGDWGVGSDLDLIVIVENSSQPFEMRPGDFDAQQLPVPTDLLVYTREEWQSLRSQSKFLQTMEREAVWIYSRP